MSAYVIEGAAAVGSYGDKGRLRETRGAEKDKEIDWGCKAQTPQAGTRRGEADLGPVAVSFETPVFHLFCQHDNHAAPLLKHHAPERVDGGWDGALRGNVGLRMIVSVDKVGVDVIGGDITGGGVERRVEVKVRGDLRGEHRNQCKIEVIRSDKA
jgi:hypothetical protein